MCNLSAWLRAACLTSIALLAACNSDEVTFESSMTLSGRVVADQPMTKSDVVGTWSVFNFENSMLMGVALRSNGELKYRLTQTNDEGIATPAGFAKWGLISNVLIIKWPKQSGQDECVSIETTDNMLLRCTTIGGTDDGTVIEYGLTPVNLASELSGTTWKSGDVTLHFTSSSYTLTFENQIFTGSWGSKELRLTLNDFATCEFTGGWIEYRSVFFACRFQAEKVERLTWWGWGHAAQAYPEGDQATPPPPLIDYEQ